MKKRLFRMRGITNLLYPPKRNPFIKGCRKYVGQKYCLFLDYDDVPYEKIVQESRTLRDYFPQLTTLWAIETKKNHYWLLSFGVYERREVLDMMFHSDCDHMYFKAFKIFGCNTLRLTQKRGDYSRLKLKGLWHLRSYKMVSKHHTEMFEKFLDAHDYANPDDVREDCGLQAVEYFVPVKGQ